MEVYSFIVAVLSFITTLLIGWQIYTLIDIGKERQRTKKAFEELKRSFENELISLNKEHNDAMFGIMGEMAMQYDNKIDLGDFRFVNYMLSSIMYGIRSGRNVEHNIKAILEYGANGLKMKKYYKTLVLDTFYQGIKPFCVDENMPLLEQMIINAQET